MISPMSFKGLSLPHRAGSANNWWERDPNINNPSNFYNTNSTGSNNNNNANNSNGVCLGFYDRPKGRWA